MKFYQERKINPLASASPSCCSSQVLFSLFYMLRTDLKKDICGNQMSNTSAGTPQADA